MPVSQQSNKTVLTHPLGASAEVHFFGATLTSWKVASEERIFLSEKAVLDGSKAIRGGIPLVFPVFGKGKAPHVTASLPQHGFARISRWRLVNSSEDAHTVTAQFGLDHNMISEEHRKMWPFDFSLVYTVKLGAETIETHLKIQNTGDQAFDFNTLLHTYFLIPDESKVRVIGLSGVDYTDKVQQKTSRQEGEVVVRGEVDSVYANVQTADIQIQYGGEDGGVQLHRNGVNDIVVWNPWTEKAAGMADFGDEEYHRMICVEAGQVAEFIALAAGGSWEGSQVLSLL
ncbi:aldose 1-epimerase [Gamsiella multidivaricata]|uniref:aldose 1-epimerase n=1 Tax=Gamsiella multidivaricata TaxID=101098 RepID=UPI00221F0C75|nr:aldose 1-epimerase [Gamsiella multidivaricata]KAI7831252.1 aldose 1-epimerase [Gamsiella multidivaricata]